MRRKVVAGNWKMNGDRASLAQIDAIAAAAAASPAVDVMLALPATLLAVTGVPVVDGIPAVAIGAQDCDARANGAHTGCLSAAMLRDAGATFTLVGHSERRAAGESDALVKAKGEAALAQGLGVILCVGETLAERDAGHAEATVTAQLDASLPDGSDSDRVMIAYEPVWAIGTGRTPTIEDVAQMHGTIRAQLAVALGEGAQATRLLYGGSVTGDNAAALLAAGDVDGALVGGASLTAAKFVPIIEAAAGS